MNAPDRRSERRPIEKQMPHLSKLKGAALRLPQDLGPKQAHKKDDSCQLFGSARFELCLGFCADYLH